MSDQAERDAEVLEAKRARDRKLAAEEVMALCEYVANADSAGELTRIQARDFPLVPCGALWMLACV